LSTRLSTSTSASVLLEVYNCIHLYTAPYSCIRLRTAAYNCFFSFLVLHADLRMDLDQHRQKRSRLDSGHKKANVNNTSDHNNNTSSTSDLNQSANTDDHHSIRVHGSGSGSPISPGPVSATATAFRNISIRDKQHSAIQVVSQPARANPPWLSANPTASPSFLHHPSLARNVASAANFSFNPNQNNVSAFPVPTSSSQFANHPHQNQLPLRSNQTDISLQSTRVGHEKDFDLPLHGSQLLQSSNHVSAGPGSKQVEANGQILPPSQHISRQQSTMYTQPSPAVARQVHRSHPSSIEMLTNPVEKFQTTAYLCTCSKER
jgi:hypothetical protein